MFLSGREGRFWFFFKGREVTRTRAGTGGKQRNVGQVRRLIGGAEHNTSRKDFSRKQESFLVGLKFIGGIGRGTDV